MTPRLLGALLFGAVSASSPALAEDWVFLGGRPPAEMDLDSIEYDRGLGRVDVRIIANDPRGRMYMNQDLAVDCLRPGALIVDGSITSDYSSRVMPMPDLPDEIREIEIPSPNEAYNAMYGYVCERGRR